MNPTTPSFYNRFKNTPLSSASEVHPHFVTWVPPQFRTRPELPLLTGQYTEYTVTDSDIGRLDILAAASYGDASLWWVIALANGISNPFEQMESGMVLRFPTRDYLHQFLV